jgi:uncharacterized protein (UPF0335 family)
MSELGHNSAAAENVAAAELRAFIERVERLYEENKSILDDIRDVYGEAKGRGYDVKAIKTIVKLRRKDVNERLEEETILQTYMSALGME